MINPICTFVEVRYIHVRIHGIHGMYISVCNQDWVVNNKVHCYIQEAREAEKEIGRKREGGGRGGEVRQAVCVRVHACGVSQKGGEACRVGRIPPPTLLPPGPAA